MHTYDYHGWTVSNEDVLYHKLIEKNINIIDADKDRVKKSSTIMSPIKQWP